MNVSQENLECVFKDIIKDLGEVFIWQWDDKRQSLLTEFSRNKKDLALPKIEQLFTDEWDKKTIKKSPDALKIQLGSLAGLVKEQRLFTSPAKDGKPAVLAIWWPWGHGGTYSLRLTVLADSYDITATPNSWWERLKKRVVEDYL
ncbi:MAG: hypothetical protein MJK12_12790 [Colwellia sp.]|nr:hypothetical protein [Colwellia sp.]